MDANVIRAELLKFTRRAYFQDKLFAATSGNLSFFDRETGRMTITPGSYPYEDMTEEDMVVIDLDGNVIEGRRRPSSEWRLHAAIYRAFEGMSAVVICIRWLKSSAVSMSPIFSSCGSSNGLTGS